jgi:parallel beta-helix repeat protein
MLTRTRRRALLALVPLAVVPLLVAATHGSSARNLTVLGCDSTITGNITLGGDLGPCGVFAVQFGADNVTLNLNGHRIFGNGGGTGVMSNFAGTVVENGTVTNFGDDVTLTGKSSRVLNLRVSQAAGSGINVGNGSNDVVSGNRVFGNGGIGILGSGAGSQYTNNILQTNGAHGLSAADASLVSGNKAFNNNARGIYVTNPAGGSVTVTNNLANGNSVDGIQVGTSGDPSVVTLTGNQAFFNATVGILGAPGVIDGGKNKASGNGTLTQCTNIACN